MNTSVIIEITLNVVTDFWKKRLMELSSIHNRAFYSVINKMPLTMNEKDYYSKLYREELGKGLTESLPEEKQENFKKEIEKRLKH